MPASTPAVIMISASRSTERCWQGVVGQLSKAVEELGVDEPVLIGIGNAFSARVVHKDNQKPEATGDQQKSAMNAQR